MTDQPIEKNKLEESSKEGPREWRIPGTAFILALPVFAFLIFGLGLALMARYTEHKTRSAIVRVKSDMRILATAIESYRVDSAIPPAMSKSRESTAGAYVLPAEVPVSRSFRMRHDTQMMTLTTPIAYIESYPVDPFREFKGTTFSYYTDGWGWILGSWGPDMDQSTGGDLQWHLGPLIPEHEGLVAIDETPPIWNRKRPGRPLPGQGVASVYYTVENKQPSLHLLTGNHNEHGEGAFTYDPTNGIFSQGDIWRVHE